MSTDSSKSSNDLGNTNSKSLKQISPAIRWSFTVHNYTDDDWCSISSSIRAMCRFGIMAKETGKSGETPHIQGYLEFKTKKRPKSLFENQTIHWEKSKGNKNHNIDYIEKEGGEIWRFPEVYKVELDLYPWQEELVTILKTKPNDRTIHWIWEETGCAGKTTFQKWVFTHMKRVVVLSGKCEDMKNGIVQYQEKNGCLPEIVLVNIPRVNSNFVSIAGLEQIKDMFFYCGKYEGGMVCGPNPHVMVFANEPPDEDKMSADRWEVINLLG